jgi:hypothetical protein
MLVWNVAFPSAPIAQNDHAGTAAFGCPAGQSLAARPVLLVRARHLLALLTFLLAPSSARASDCIPIHDAGQHIGEVKCVTGKVIRVKVGVKSVHFLDFCEDSIACPFTVVVFGHDLKDVGDVRRLAGRTIEIRGTLKVYDGRPEIILSRISQIEGGAAMIPPLPKNYDVENHGHFSAGRLYPSKKPKKTKAKPSPNMTYGNDVEGEETRSIGFSNVRERSAMELFSSPSAWELVRSLPKKGRSRWKAGRVVVHSCAQAAITIESSSRGTKAIPPRNAARLSHQSLAQFLQRILRPPPYDAVIPQRQEHRP